jgi:hypothetical protein
MSRNVAMVSVASSLLACGIWVWGQEAETQRDAVPFMRIKLVHTKEIVEGLALGDLDAVARHSQKLSLMSLESNWNVVQTPEYSAASKEFRGSVNRLYEAAKAKNLDATTLAYFEVTLNCVRCHRYLRERPPSQP